jgi:uncharacterized membrane protein
MNRKTDIDFLYIPTQLPLISLHSLNQISIIMHSIVVLALAVIVAAAPQRRGGGGRCNGGCRGGNGGYNAAYNGRYNGAYNGAYNGGYNGGYNAGYRGSFADLVAISSANEIQAAQRSSLLAGRSRDPRSLLSSQGPLLFSPALGGNLSAEDEESRLPEPDQDNSLLSSQKYILSIGPAFTAWILWTVSQIEGT